MLLQFLLLQYDYETTHFEGEKRYEKTNETIQQPKHLWSNTLTPVVFPRPTWYREKTLAYCPLNFIYMPQYTQISHANTE